MLTVLWDIDMRKFHATTIDETSFEDKRHYYSLVMKEGECWIIACRNGLTLMKIMNQLVEVKIGTNLGYAGFVPEEYIGKTVGKITVMVRTRPNIPHQRLSVIIERGVHIPLS